MNQMLDSRIEALAFNYVSFGIFTIVNNLWTWVAVITAAVSFWRIRAAAASASAVDPKPSACCIISRTQDESRPILEAQEKPTTPSAAVAETSAASPFVCDDGGVTTKGRKKFTLTVYYEDGGESDVVDDDGERRTVNEWRSDGGGAGDCKGAAGEWWDCWERVLGLRNGEKGWYCCQDLTAINGNVVRLWDESKSKSKSNCRYSSSCAVW